MAPLIEQVSQLIEPPWTIKDRAVGRVLTLGDVSTMTERREREIKRVVSLLRLKGYAVYWLRVGSPEGVSQSLEIHWDGDRPSTHERLHAGTHRASSRSSGRSATKRS